MKRARWALYALLGLSACSSDATPLTQIVVVVDSDLDVPSELDALSIDVSLTKSNPNAMASLAKNEDLPRSLGIVYGGGALGPFRVTVTGWHGDATVVTRTADVSFTKDTSLRLSLMLTRACRDIATQCDDDQSCDDGACVDDAISDLPAWTGKLPPHSSMTMSDADGGVSPAADGGGSGDGNVAGAGGGKARGGSGGGSGGNGASGSGGDDQRPMCTIDAPADGTHFYAGDSVELRGSCVDPDDDAPSSVTWRDKTDMTEDSIGAEYSTHFTPGAGEHTITFCGADRSDGTLLGCSSSITITVEALPDVTAMISSIKQGNSTTPPFSADSSVIASGSGAGIAPVTLHWTDSLIGDLGSGAMQTLTSPLTVGKHALALTVTDARSRTATATSSTFNVLASGDSSLFAPYDAFNLAVTASTGPVVAIDADANYLYVASRNGVLSGLYKIDRSSAPKTANPVLVKLITASNEQIRDLSLHSASGHAYMAVSGGVKVCDYSLSGGIDTGNCSTLSACSTPDTTRVMRVTSAGSSKDYVLVGTPSGLCVCDSDVANCALSSQVGSVKVSSFAVASDALWVGTDAGLYKIDLTVNDGVMNPAKVDAVKGSLTGLSLGDSALWIGSTTGVTRMDPSNNNSTSFWATSTSVGAFQHLISSDIRAVAVSRPVLGSNGQRDVAWIATSAGVSRFDSSVPSFTSFTTADGLPSNSVRAVLTLSSGDKVFGTDSGLALFRGP